MELTFYRFPGGTDPGKSDGMSENGGGPTRLEDCGPEGAQLVGSGCPSDHRHIVVLDIDMPCHLVESSPGKHHLFIEKAMDWRSYRALLVALEQAGIIERGYLEASLQRGFTCVRVKDGTPTSAPSIVDTEEPF